MTTIEVTPVTKHAKDECPFACFVSGDAKAERENLAVKRNLTLKDLIDCYITHYRDVLKRSLGVYSGLAIWIQKDHYSMKSIELDFDNSVNC